MPPAYVSTFRPVPQAGNIAPQDRDLTDMDDAMAQDNLMMLKESDQAQAAAVAGEIRSQAVTQKMLAGWLRQEAARVAHENAIRKRNAAYSSQLQTDMTNVLQHK
ncbi:MAG: hypothetical protein ABSH56_33265 [Bryobacteraceae bacterium]